MRRIGNEKWTLPRKSRKKLQSQIDGLRRISCEETDKARQLRIDELSMQQERNPTTVRQLLIQIQDLQNEVNSLFDTRECYDPETASSSGASHVPSQPLTIPSPRGMRRLPLETRNTMRTSGNVLESLPAREGPPSTLLEN